MSTTGTRKNVTASLVEVIFFFVLIPALLSYMLLHVGEDGIFSMAGEQKVAFAITAEDFLRQFPGCDISYQLQFAVDYVRDGSIAAWVLNLWPPGLPALYILILKLSGSDHFPLKIIALSVCLYALASYSVYRSLARGRFSPTLLAVCALPLLYASFQKSIFLKINLFSSDFYCFALLAILLSLMFGQEEKSLGRLALMAAVLAALAYFRSFYFIFIKLLIIGSLFSLVAWLVYAIVRRGWSAAITEVAQNKPIASLGVVLLLAWVLLLPWKVFLQENGRTFEWTETEQAWAAQWRNDLPSFLVGLNTPCIMEKEICEQLMPFQYADTWATPKLGSDFYKRLSIMTFVSNPLQWYGEKAKVFHYFWFDGVEFDRKMSASSWMQYLQSAVLLVACLGLALLAVVRLLGNLLRNRPIFEGNGLYGLFLFFCIYNLIVFTFVHYEPRYSVPLKWVTYLFAIFIFKDIMHKFDLRLFGNRVRRVVE